MPPSIFSAVMLRAPRRLSLRVLSRCCLLCRGLSRPAVMRAALIFHASAAYGTPRPARHDGEWTKLLIEWWCALISPAVTPHHHAADATMSTSYTCCHALRLYFFAIISAAFAYAFAAAAAADVCRLLMLSPLDYFLLRYFRFFIIF